jgi:SAM-dependent methyltransferase
MVAWSSQIIRLDASKGLPFPDGSVDAIYSSHMLEHIYLSDARRVLGESRRVLKAAGILRLALPDSEKLAEDLLAGVRGESSDPGLEFNRKLLAHPMERPSLRQRLLGTVGASVHRWQPTRSLVRQLLLDSGFSSIEEHSFRQGRLPDLSAVEDREESFFIEAR